MTGIRLSPHLPHWRYMLEVFCEGNHCDQYVHSIGGTTAQCLMVQRELSRVGACPLRYDRIAVKEIPEEQTHSRSGVKGEPARKKRIYRQIKII